MSTWEERLQADQDARKLAERVLELAAKPKLQPGESTEHQENLKKLWLMTDLYFTAGGQSA